jgi:serine phosphatase RsbU (regulator of sigma subunit)
MSNLQMLEKIYKRMQLGIWLALIAPTAIITLLSAMLLARARLEAHEARFTASAENELARLESLLSAEAARLLTIAQLASVSELAQAGGRAPGRDGDEAQLEAQWARASNEDMLVRAITENEVAKIFRQLKSRDSHLKQLVLTDLRGRTLAASEKTDRYSHQAAAWWAITRKGEPEIVYSPGIDAMGRLELGVAVLRAGREAIVDGFLYASIDLAELADRVGLRSTPKRVVLVLGRDAPWIIGGAEQAGSRGARFADKLHLRAGAAGHVEGYRYRALPLSGGIAWARPIRLVAGISESEMPLRVIWLPAVLFIGGIGIMVALSIAGVTLARTHIIEPTRESSEAGVWAIQTAFGRGESGGPASPIQRELASWLQNLQHELLRHSESISAEVARDLELATEFQQAFLNRPYPLVPELHLPGRLRLEFHHRYQPALAMGGDFFDITPISNDCVGIFVGDVMGHGTRSALIVAILRTLIAELSRRARNAPHFLRELNNEFCKVLQPLAQPLFASAAYFVADTTSRIATYSVAGHPPPFYLHRAIGRVTRLDLPRPHGVALGLIPGEEYGGGTVRLNDGDAFIFFTDGVYEAADIHGEEFGLNRLEQVIKANVYKPSKEILDAVIDAIGYFTREQPVADDICLVAVDVRTDPR